MQRNLPENITRLIYLPKNGFESQKGPTCYFYAYLRAMHFQGLDLKKIVPSYCYDLIKEIELNAEQEEKEQDTKPYESMKEEIDDSQKSHDKRGLIYKKYLTSEKLNNINEKYFSDHPYQSIDDLWKYEGHNIMTYLLELKKVELDTIVANEEDPCPSFCSMNIEDYATLLRTQGPFVIDGMFGLNKDPSVISTAIEGQNIYNVDEGEFYQNPFINQHVITVIGCQAGKGKDQRIFYIDPMESNKILSLNFSRFTDNVNNFSHFYCHPEKNKLIPDIDTIPSITHNADEQDFDDSPTTSPSSSSHHIMEALGVSKKSNAIEQFMEKINDEKLELFHTEFSRYIESDDEELDNSSKKMKYS